MFQIPIPTNAPTEGVAALYFWLLVGLAILAMVLVKLLPTGNQRLSERRAENATAISVLQGQVAALQNEVGGLKREVKRMGIAEERNREYRHVLANQVHVLQAWSETAYSIFGLIFEEWPECPHHIHHIVEQMKKPSEILARYPLPNTHEVADSDLDDE